MPTQCSIHKKFPIDGVCVHKQCPHPVLSCFACRTNHADHPQYYFHIDQFLEEVEKTFNVVSMSKQFEYKMSNIRLIKEETMINTKKQFSKFIEKTQSTLKKFYELIDSHILNEYSPYLLWLSNMLSLRFNHKSLEENTFKKVRAYLKFSSDILSSPQECTSMKFLPELLIEETINVTKSNCIKLQDQLQNQFSDFEQKMNSIHLFSQSLSENITKNLQFSTSYDVEKLQSTEKVPSRNSSHCSFEQNSQELSNQSSHKSKKSRNNSEHSSKSNKLNSDLNKNEMIFDSPDQSGNLKTLFRVLEEHSKRKDQEFQVKVEDKSMAIENSQRIKQSSIYETKQVTNSSAISSQKNIEENSEEVRKFKLEDSAEDQAFLIYNCETKQMQDIDQALNSSCKSKQRGLLKEQNLHQLLSSKQLICSPSEVKESSQTEREIENKSEQKKQNRENQELQKSNFTFQSHKQKDVSHSSGKSSKKTSFRYSQREQQVENADTQ